MKATEANLLAFIKKSPQFIIPIYQRTYSWTEKECKQLWDDILRTGSNDSISAHFVGSIVYIEKGIYQVTSQSQLLVIDGQQRLTTVTLLIAALANAIGDNELFEGFSRRKLRNYYLLNPEEDREMHFKLILSQADKQSLINILESSEQSKEHSIRVVENFNLFETLLNDQPSEIATVCKGLSKLVVVDIALNRDQDNPQLIFESMNSTGRELSQADLIRNYVLMGLEPSLQTRLYEKYWRPMEIEFGQEAYGIHFDGFMRHYLTVKTGSIPNIGGVYEAFKEHSRSPNIAQAGVEALVKDINTFANYFCAMALGKEQDSQLKVAFQDLRELKVDVTYPLLLELYHDYICKILSKKDFLILIQTIESYVFRRTVCAIPSNSMNKTFATLSKSINKEKHLESIQSYLLLLPSYRRFPNDDEFKREIKTKDLYKFRNRSYWIRRLENHGRKERVSIDEYTIEHIMPQNEKLSTAWKTTLGSEWKRVHQTYLHTLGNLTLTGYNSEYSDQLFSEKRDMEKGFRESPLNLNQGLSQVEEWNEDAICKRAERLSTLALDVWVYPKLKVSVIDSYKSKPEALGYSINDHPYLLTKKNRELFEAFRKEVLALDPCVTEEFFKLYVAYKAETNFVDIVPQANRLRLSLNMSFNEINDPQGICKDVTKLGRWGNGDVEIGLSSLSQLPYVIGLVRQSLEQQMGGSEG
jgi:uncharacterized protein with ParB-like and HNH nuclease domain/predicted transport protein